MTTTKQETSSGLRYNTGKVPLHLISWATITEVAKVLAFGANKYEPRNWEKGLSYSDTFSSLQRHLTAWFNGEDRDPETKELHLAHVMCNAMFLLHFALTGTGTDDRPINKEPLPDARRITAREEEQLRDYLYRGGAIKGKVYPVEPGRLFDLQAYVRPPTESGCGCNGRMARYNPAHFKCE